MRVFREAAGRGCTWARANGRSGRDQEQGRSTRRSILKTAPLSDRGGGRRWCGRVLSGADYTDLGLV
jgi:hypothetical protein